MKLAIIHFLPLEKYPPAMNFLEFLDEQNIQANVWSTKLDAAYNEFSTSNVTIHRLSGVQNNERKIIRLLKYLNFNLYVLFSLIRYRPDKILYFETLSGLPALLLKKIFPERVKLFVHYHEYTSPEEYRNGMFLNRFIHSIEKKLYNLFDWISHTNEVRASLFKRDVGLNDLDVKIVPNYPPLKWKLQSKRNKSNQGAPLKMVYVGALCTDTMYVREICEWVVAQNGAVHLDFWSHNISNSADVYFKEVSSSWISLKGGVDYYSLPKVLAEYDMGLILYMGHIPNYVHNAPNKLFEYLVCGLDVLFPEELKGTYPYICEAFAPRVIKVNFNKLEDLDYRTLLAVSPVNRREINFFAEEVYSTVVRSLE
ncbi:glycosyltransferase family protein [Botryobacter ruber]|uniref:hypothetical protein n=1 Tax=Botryobacter ruber TaxID=2171629 RepID=UPI000E0B7611|nr:hypothetical protein [Botryobacter ruber]